MRVYIKQLAKVQLFSHICKFLLLFFAYFHFFLYFCTVKTQIMAIGNVTPDSFYPSSRLADTDQIISWARKAISDGAAILDIGACSTRPGSTPVPEEEEWKRLLPALDILRREMPEAQLSLDTFRPEIARRALEHFGPMIINDISSGCEEMYEVVRHFSVPYVWTLKEDLFPCTDAIGKQKILDNTRDIHEIILDPGIGFRGGVEQDYACLRLLDQLREYNRPILVGVSRKSMVYKPLGLTPETCLCATQALQLYALEHGATIIRTHDVTATKQTITLWEKINK